MKINYWFSPANYIHNPMSFLSIVICDSLKLPIEHFRSSRRHKDIVEAKTIFIYLAKKYKYGNNNEQTAFVNLNHSSGCHKIKAAQMWMESDKEFLKKVELIENKLNEVC